MLGSHTYKLRDNLTLLIQRSPLTSCTDSLHAFNISIYIFIYKYSQNDGQFFPFMCYIFYSFYYFFFVYIPSEVIRLIWIQKIFRPIQFVLDSNRLWLSFINVHSNAIAVGHACIYKKNSDFLCLCFKFLLLFWLSPKKTQTKKP